MFRKAATAAVLTVVLPLLAMTGASSTASAVQGPKAVSLAPAQVEAMTTNIAGMAYAALPTWSPSNWTDPGGVSLNNPNATKASRRRKLVRIKKMVNAVRGYRVSDPRNCPKSEYNAPNTIKIALYSFSDYPVADALVAAHRRCVSVQVLMNDHLTNRQVPAFGKLQSKLGTRLGTRSWARRCVNGCRGGGVLHSKIFLFSKSGKDRRAVGFGSSNMTGKAADVQWNDLYFMHNRTQIWAQFQLIFKEMRRDQAASAPIHRDYVDGPFLSMFWPQYNNRPASDRVLRELRRVDCTRRPADGFGYRGRTVVRINIHAMEGDRGVWIADKIIRMRKQGCNVKVLYGLIAPRIHRMFKAGGVSTRRTIFDRDGNGLTEMYTHMKNLLVNGRYAGSAGTKVAYTGSENFGSKTVVADEVWVRIMGYSAYGAYNKWFNMIWNSNYYSNPRYAFYSQSSTPVHARHPGAIIVDDEDLERG